MRKSALAGSAAKSAAPSAESATIRRPILSMVMRWKLVVGRHIRCASAAVNPPPASSLAVEPPVGPRGADHHHLAQRLTGQKADDLAVGVGDIERLSAWTLQALENALDRRRRADAVDARAHERARRLVAAVLAHCAQDVLA